MYNAQIGKMLKPEKWQASFDSDGRVSGFQKALKLIILGVCFHFGRRTCNAFDYSFSTVV